MNIWILNQYADGPDQPITRHYDIGRILVGKGHVVTIFSSSFHHYLLRDLRLQTGEKWKAQSIEGVRFLWLRTPPYRSNTWRRLVNMLVYFWRATMVGWKLREKPDVIIGACGHILVPLSAYLLSLLKGGRFFFEVGDLWPQTLVDMGALGERDLLTRFLRWLERFLFRKAEMIISHLPHVGDYVDSIGLPGSKVVWIPNGADFNRLPDMSPYQGGNPESFTVMYLGGHARYHKLDVALEAAEFLQKESKKNIRFVFVGDGAEKPRLVELARRMGLRNVEFRGLVPKSEIWRVMSEADALLFCFRKMKVLKYGTNPMKIFDYLCSGRPIIYAQEASNAIVEQAKAGITVPPEDPEAMARAITRLSELPPEERIAMGKNGLEYMKRNHDIRLLSERLEACLLSGTDTRKVLGEADLKKRA